MANKPELRAEVTMVTAFQDADPMGVVYHGNYFRFFEEARRVLMDKLSYNYRDMQASGFVWPIIDTRVKYVKPIPFNHEIRVVATLTEWENRLKVEYVIFDAQTGARMTKGYTMQVAVGIESGEMCFVSPKVFTDKVDAWFADAIA
ncbi:acyl-CoA thioesterase [Photobacterium aphoticum]|uniref:4-hydroxybenzoyl-CoA thioesterase n=1 Tax=Photobacterium aphoticum TaxID=754436 RepID=A0A090QHR9_9GAMM|nr:acyl-CoA thioesterase [Photobacterium aphoticum]KLV01701.1 4-hydroxybenzoyl-CoA thioesterase [Photobacterium aphoticum]PSU59277.1 acyl-CoA thioesterase [Photobacterium aphoticum]GAL02451.1 4-hydroxybenzoyl-CoA thioesterase domain protein [Photobacterium aphoticum]GHA31553.1 4-hydroxybenzoyl-CoA thioesterase [Photobacterium aphoticum]